MVRREPGAMKRKRDIFSAVKDGDTASVKRLIDAGADVNARNLDGNTPLHLACLWGHMDIVRLLIETGAELNTRDDSDCTPLHLTCFRGLTEIARFLIEHGADVNASNDYGRTLLHRACSNGRPGIVRLLLEHGADVDARNKRGETPLNLTLQLPRDNPAREEIIDLFRQYAPETVMEAFCTMAPGGM
jgi:ankyrin repeat protein